VYYVMVGSDGPCEISFNMGGKQFRSNHDETEYGLISRNGVTDQISTKGAKKSFSLGMSTLGMGKK
jgi:hypothetical protein